MWCVGWRGEEGCCCFIQADEETEAGPNVLNTPNKKTRSLTQVHGLVPTSQNLLDLFVSGNLLPTLSGSKHLRHFQTYQLGMKPNSR